MKHYSLNRRMTKMWSKKIINQVEFFFFLKSKRKKIINQFKDTHESFFTLDGY